MFCQKWWNYNAEFKSNPWQGIRVSHWTNHGSWKLSCFWAVWLLLLLLLLATHGHDIYGKIRAATVTVYNDPQNT